MEDVMRALVLISIAVFVLSCGGSDEPATPPPDTTTAVPSTGISSIDPAIVRAAQSEAKMILRQIHTLEQAHFAETNKYAASPGDLCAGARFETIGLEVPPTSRYVFRITVAGSGYTATATANLDSDPTRDIWCVDQTGSITNRSNDAVN
jgi:Tfp pilus assembly protein PilE